MEGLQRGVVYLPGHVGGEFQTGRAPIFCVDRRELYVTLFLFDPVRFDPMCSFRLTNTIKLILNFSMDFYFEGVAVISPLSLLAAFVKFPIAHIFIGEPFLILFLF